MTNLLYQGIADVPDLSEQVKATEAGADSRLAAVRYARSADPKLREECGVMAIYGHPEAARQAARRLDALQM